MAGAGPPLHDLGQGVEEVEDLRHQEQEQRLGKVAQDAGNCQRHARKVAKRVPNKDSRRVPESSRGRRVVEARCVARVGLASGTATDQFMRNRAATVAMKGTSRVAENK